MNFQDLRAVIVTWLMAAAWRSAWASSAIQEPPKNLSDLPLFSILGAIGLTLLGGMANSMRDIKRALDEKQEVNLRVRLAADVAMSIVVGLVTWAAVAKSGGDVYTLVIMLVVAGLGGAKAADMFVGAYGSFIERIVGGGNKSPPHQPPT